MLVKSKEKVEELARQHRQLVIASQQNVQIQRCHHPHDYLSITIPSTSSHHSPQPTSNLTLRFISSVTTTSIQQSHAMIWSVHLLRLQQGVNLGGYFIPEVWMNPSFYQGTGLGWSGSLCTMFQNNSRLTEQRMLHSLQANIQFSEFLKMKQLGFNSIRLPIGYWNIIEDPFHRYSPIQLSTSQMYIHRIFEYCLRTNISVLIDLHGLPNSQNGIDHSGCSIFPQWLHSTKPINTKLLSLQTIETIMQDYSHYANFLGMELANEPSLMYYENVTWTTGTTTKGSEFPKHDSTKTKVLTGRYFDELWDYYQQSYQIVRKYHPSCYVYINELYAEYYDLWVYLLHSASPRMTNVIIDYHLYNWQLPYTYESSRQHIQDSKDWQLLIERYEAIVIGEWSMSTGTFLQVGQPFVQQCLHSFRSAHGHYLWTWQLERGIGFDAWDVQFQAELWFNGSSELKTLPLNPFPKYQPHQ